MPLYVCSLPNPGEPGVPHECIADDPAVIEAFAQREDKPGRGVYDCVSPLKPGARRRALDTVGEVVALHVDIDSKDIAEDMATVDARLASLMLSPTEVRNSGHGRHVRFELKEAIAADDAAEVARATAVLKELTAHLCGDMAVAHYAALLRRPGTHNSKGGAWLAVDFVMLTGARYDLGDVEDWLGDVSDRTLFTRKGTGNGHDKSALKGSLKTGAERPREANLKSSSSKYKPPIDVEARLAAMRHRGAGDSSIHQTQLSTTASLLRGGVALQETTRTVLDATRAAVANNSQWNWRNEELKILRMGFAFIVKHPELVTLLPDAWRQRFADAIAQGRRPDIGLNTGGFYVRGVATAETTAPSKRETIRRLLLKGTTPGEVCAAIGWERVSLQRYAHLAGLTLTKYQEDGVTKYKGVSEDPAADGGRAPPFEAPPSPAGDSGTSRKLRFKLVAFSDLRPGLEPPYLVDELIPVAGLVDVWGKAKCYKSFWTLDVMLHVAMGWEYRDRYVRQGAVVYCAFEGAHGYKKRIEAQRRFYKLSDDATVPLYVMPGQANLIAEHTVLISDITAQLGSARPAAVVLDTLNKSLFGSENKDVDMGAYVRAAEAIRDAFSCVVIIVHHCGYDDTRPRGHSSLPGAVDAQLAVTRTEEVITVTVEMMRDGPEETQVVSAVEVVDVGKDQNGKVLTSLVVVPSDADAAIRERRDWPRGLSVLHAALKNVLATKGEMFQPEAGVLAVRAVDQWLVRDRFYATYAEGEEDTAKRQAKLQKAFVRALADAQQRNAVRTMRTDTGQTLLWLPQRGEDQ